jgi:hypothetical protein
MVDLITKEVNPFSCQILLSINKSRLICLSSVAVLSRIAKTHPSSYELKNVFGESG